MSTNVIFNGVTYSVPASGEINWSSLSAFLLALGNNAATNAESKQAVRIALTSPVTIVAATDYAVLTNLTVPGAVAVALPAGVAGQLFLIKDDKLDANVNNITITPNLTETIAGAATLVLNRPGQTVLLQFTAGDWKILLNAPNSEPYQTALSWTGGGPYTMTVTALAHDKGLYPQITLRSTDAGVSTDFGAEIAVTDGTGDFTITSDINPTGYVVVR